MIDICFLDVASTRPVDGKSVTIKTFFPEMKCRDSCDVTPGVNKLAGAGV